MYTPKAFKVEDEAAAYAHMERYGFATLVSVEGPSRVSHLPMLASRARRVVRGHLARPNPHASDIDGRRQLAIFLGPDAYVSPDWYDDADQVPTWNYSAVHVVGTARVLSEPAAVDELLAEFSDHHERARHDLADGKLWSMSKLPDEKRARMRAAIIAFEIDIESLEFKAKLSQNKAAHEVERVAAKLSAGNERQQGIADAMRRTREGRP